MKDKKEGKEPRLNGEKRFYLFTAIGCAAALIAIIVIAMVISSVGKVESTEAKKESSSVQTPVESSGEGETDKPVGEIPDGMIIPVEGVAVSVDYGFYHNQTLNAYYEHAGVDFSAAAGTAVKAAESGKVESIYKSDVLLGTEIVVAHENGLKTVYRFVTEAEGLKVGDEVKKGEVIATIAEATGEEYKDGPHLHFEVLQNGERVDPALHLTLEEK